MIGASPGTVEKLEAGLRPIGAGSLYRLACALSVDVLYFFAEDADEPDPPPLAGTATSARQVTEAEEFARAYARLKDPAVRFSVSNLVALLAGEEVPFADDAEPADEFDWFGGAP